MLDRCRHALVPVGHAVADGARLTALEVLDGAPVAVGVVAVDRSGTVVGTSGLP